MTTRQPRRARRRTTVATTLPRPDGSVTRVPEQGAAIRRSAQRLREHHVTTDYSHVHRDLIMIAAVGAVSLAFIVGMSFVL